MRKLFVILLCLYSIVAVSSTTVFRISTDNPESSLHVYSLRKLNELLEKYSKGKVKVEIYYRGNKKAPAIKGEEVNVNMVVSEDESSSIDGTVVAVGNLAIRAKLLNFFMLPYVFPTSESAKKLFKSDYLNKDINKILEEKHNIRVISWLSGGYRHLTNSKRPVTKIGDIKGLIIRTPRNKVMAATYRAFGAKVEPLNWGDVPDALTSGKIDGQENPYNVVATMKFWHNKQKYLTKTGPFFFVATVAINKRKYLSLPKDLQEAVDRAGREAAEAEWKWIEEKDSEFISEIEKNGIKILDLADRENWINATKPILKSSYKDIGYGDPDMGKKVIDKVLSITSK